MSSTWKAWLCIQSLLLLVLSNVEAVCVYSCQCSSSEENNSSIVCQDSAFKDGAQLCDYSFDVRFNVNTTSELSIRCSELHLQRNVFRNAFNLARLSIVQSNLIYLPFDLSILRGHLKYLNLSHNSISNINFSSLNDLFFLEILDVSHNIISTLNLDQSVSTTLSTLFLQQNDIRDFNVVKYLSSLEALDASYNPLSFEQSKLYEILQLKKLVLQSVDAVKESNKKICSSKSQCKLLPSNLNVLDLCRNRLTRVPSCNGLLFGLKNLQVLLLEYNDIPMVFKSSFESGCYSNLKVLSLRNNQLMRFDSSVFVHLSLQSLILSENHLQHISYAVLEHFSNSSNGHWSLYGSTYQNGVNITNNPWACDCFQQALHDWLFSHNSTISIECNIPDKFKGKQLKSLNRSDLRCFNASIIFSQNATKILEFEDGRLICRTSGVPKPTVQWYTPQDVPITSELTSEDQPYRLSAYGEELTVKDVRLAKTGFYRCTANNSFGTASSMVILSVVPSSISTIIFLVIACVAFVIAIILNSVNMCMYIYEHIQTKRRYKKAIQEQKREEQLNSPIQRRTRATVDESMASLNADRHYGKYDFTCQQMFLDTVIKGAHSVKKTLYDARHSEFSNNVWGYAASIKDRLHIELPSQLPTISMPSISMPTITMPTISMPSIPTMHDINTNIEKLGSSVMTRSHNLATSVGSVFTLKRWMWQQQDTNASDNESKESDENLEKVDGETSVNVDVHRTNDGHLSPDDVFSSSKHFDRREGVRSAFSKLLSNRADSEISTANSSKSLPNYTRRSTPSHPTIESKSTTKNVSFLPEQSTQQPSTSAVKTNPGPLIENPSIITISQRIDKPLHSYETSV